VGWFNSFFDYKIQPPKRASEAQRAIALTEVREKLDTPELITDSAFEQIGKNFQIVRTFMETLEDDSELDAYEYWVGYFEGKYKQAKKRRDSYRKTEDEKKSLKDTFSRPKW
jgi:hypothetical protein